ncbi:hypothetical protein GCM10027059_12790 [Myceligenerans halotolerans]
MPGTTSVSDGRFTDERSAHPRAARRAGTRRLAALGHPVFCADVWGERTQPQAEPEIGPLIGAMAARAWEATTRFLRETLPA